MQPVRSADPGAKRGKRRILDSLFAGLASVSLLVTGFATAAAADPMSGREELDNDPGTSVTEETVENEASLQDEQAQSGSEVPSDEALVPTGEQSLDAPREAEPAAAGGNNSKVVISDVKLIREGSGSDPMQIGDKVKFSAEWDASEADPQPGETFYVALPPEFKLLLEDGQTFPLTGNAEDGSLLTWANCEVDTETSSVTCTFTDAVKDWDEVKGSINFDIQAIGATEEKDLDFDLNGKVTPVEVPGGGGIRPPAPPKIEKSGKLVDNNTAVEWKVDIPGSVLAGADEKPVYLFDSLSANMKLCEPLQLSVKAGKNDVTEAVGANVLTTDLPEGASFKVQLNEPEGGFDDSVTYSVIYKTCTTSGTIDPQGTSYRNDVSVSVTGVEGDGIGVEQNWDSNASSKGHAWVSGTRQSQVHWTVRVPDELLRTESGGSFTFSDELTGPQEVCEATLGDSMRVLRRFGPNGPTEDVTSKLTKTVVSSETQKFEVKFEIADQSFNWNPDDTNYVYLITYNTCVTTETDLPPTGTELGNTANVGEFTAKDKFTVKRDASKSGSLNAKEGVVIDGIEHNANSTINWNIVIPGEKLKDLKSELVLEDIFKGPHSVCPAGPAGGTVSDRLNLKVQAQDQLGGSDVSESNRLATVDLKSSAEEIDGGLKITVPLPDPKLPLPNGELAEGFSEEYRYVVSYTTCTDSGAWDEQGTTYSNTVDGYGVEMTGEVTQEHSAGGTGTGVAKGSVSVQKKLAGNASTLVPEWMKFTVHVKEIRPDGTAATEYDISVPLNGDPVKGLNSRGKGWKIELSEPTFPQIDGVEFGTPKFEADKEGNIQISEDGKTATVDLLPRQNVGVVITNEAKWVSGEVSVVKALTGGAAAAVPADREYVVKASFEVPEHAPAVADKELKLKVGEPQVISGLPVGTKVTFTETVPVDEQIEWTFPGFTPSQTVVVTGDKSVPVEVTVTNTAAWAPGTFGISKLITGVQEGTAGIPEEVTVTATWEKRGEEISQEIKVPTNGEFVELGFPLPYGTEVTLSELKLDDTASYTWDAPIWGGEGVVANEDGTATLIIGAATTAEVELTNNATAKLGELTVTKTVVGAGASKITKDTVFPVTASWVDIEGKQQSVELKLSKDTPVTLKDLPIGTVVKFEEGNAKLPSGAKWSGVKWSTTSENAEVTADGKTATLVVTGDSGAAADLKVENTIGTELPKTGFDGSTAVLMSILGLIIAGGGAFLVWRGRKA